MIISRNIGVEYCFYFYQHFFVDFCNFSEGKIIKYRKVLKVTDTDVVDTGIARTRRGASFILVHSVHA